MKFFKTIKFRLTIWYVLVMVILLALFATAAYTFLYEEMYRNLDNSLKARVDELHTSLTGSNNSNMLFAGSISEIVLFYDTNDKLVQRLGPSTEFVDIANLIEKARAGESNFYTAETTAGQNMRLYATPFDVSKDLHYTIVVGRTPAEIQGVLKTLRTIFLISALVMIVFVGLGGAFLASRTLKPVDRITVTARAISESDLSRRIDVESEDELGRLASTLNKMIARLEVAFKRQREFTADASHEMRTPLAVIQAESTLALEKERSIEEYRHSLEVISQEVDFMSEILGKLLYLARSDAGKEPFQIEDINLSDMITQLSVDMDVLAREKEITFELGAVEPVTLPGDKLKLRQMMINLFSNAIRYTPAGGRVSSSLILQDDTAVINVTDTGIGISAEHLPFIFERFYRVDKARSRSEGGSGLGLAIVKQIVEIHHGRIEVESESGKGTTFRVYLPLNHNPAQ